MSFTVTTRLFTTWHAGGFAWLVSHAHAHHVPVVVANGCFDRLHPGHVGLLEHARACEPEGLLIVALNDDASVRRLKGPGRPLLPLDERLLVVSALRAVDVAVGFAEDTPEALLAFVRPGVLVKGADYREHEVVGRQHAARISLAPTRYRSAGCPWSTTLLDVPVAAAVPLS